MAGDPVSRLRLPHDQPLGLPGQGSLRPSRPQVEEPHLGRLMEKIRSPLPTGARRLTYRPAACRAANHPQPIPTAILN
jgi:hypothetical protein